LFLLVLLSFGGITVVHGDISDLSLEQLMAVEVTTLAKKEQSLSTVAAAVHVITAEDIRRSSASTLPELLETVPGMFSAPVAGGVSGVSARGFVDRFANKLLVLIDGRSVYTPLFSGVFWESHDIILSDVERIEIIRGPGGTLWGANAVNGIINVITKDARDTIGGLVQVEAGNQATGMEARYGWQASDDLALRIYGFGREREAGYLAGGSYDDWGTLRGGMRLDWRPGDDDHLLCEAEIYDVRSGQNIFIPGPVPSAGQERVDETKINGGYALTRWSRKLDDESDMELQVYWDHTRHKSLAYEYTRHTIDFDFQHRARCWDAHEFVWGLGYRGISDEIGSAEVVSEATSDQTYHLFSAFLQDEIDLTPELKLTVGTKVEHNDFSGVEWQPSARISWMPTKRQTLWAAYSRAVRTPSRAGNDVVVNLGVAGGQMATLVGNDDFDSETVDAFELGFRSVLKQSVTLDLALFYNDYRDLRTLEPVDALTTTFGNEMTGESYGAEAVVAWQVEEWVKLHGGYSFAKATNHLTAVSGNTGGSEAEEEEYPQHQAYVGLAFDFNEQWSADLVGRYADNIPEEKLGRFFEMNARLGWKPKDDLEIALVGHNLLDNRRPAIGKQPFLRIDTTEVRRSILMRLTYEF
jgi:iron complex outermembrane receptor protein